MRTATYDRYNGLYCLYASSLNVALLKRMRVRSNGCPAESLVKSHPTFQWTCPCCRRNPTMIFWRRLARYPLGNRETHGMNWLYHTFVNLRMVQLLSMWLGHRDLRIILA